jgi:tRNA dimethylallyltransferase
MTLSPPRPVVIVGPTATGKSRLALELARELGGAIISADSRQIYRYMDIGTAKPSVAERAGVPHFMLDLVEPSETYTSQRFAQEGGRVLKRVMAQGAPPLVVGGTGYYIRALLDGLGAPEVKPDETLRADLREEAAAFGSERLHARLAALDPESAKRIHPRNLPRIIRALEIVEHLGKPVPHPRPSEPVDALYLGLAADRQRLKRLADERVDRQMAAGLLEETRLLLEMGYSPDAPGLRGFGYRQMIDVLFGRSSMDEAIERYKVLTHQYIRRQMTWFRRDTRIVWLDTEGDVLQTSRDLIRRCLLGLRANR